MQSRGVTKPGESAEALTPLISMGNAWLVN